jgi:hypothetical protein
MTKSSLSPGICEHGGDIIVMGVDPHVFYDPVSDGERRPSTGHWGRIVSDTPLYAPEPYSLRNAIAE